MPLSPGTRFGPYEILAPLGAGGMGEVYRARDTRLGRDVAVKILPENFAADPERLHRFEQEARSVAALNHPNILSVHDIGEQNGTRFIVTELLEGETLRDRLAAGALPVRKSVEIAAQVSRGVAAAHEKGIIHRDLKPANIFLLADGRVKILDFGLAKLAESSAQIAAETQTAGHITTAGTLLGTIGYMSPEQVRGKPADARSDIFALGAVLFEMLSGRRAFEKDSTADTMAAILNEDPPELAASNLKIPPALERIVRHCLEKNPAERFQSARDLAFALDSVSNSSESVISQAASVAPAGNAFRKLIFPLSVLAALLAGAVATWLFAARFLNSADPAYHQLTFKRGMIYSARFSPDGQSIYYGASWNGGPIKIYSTNVHGPESRELGLENSTVLAISPSSDFAIASDCRDLFFGHCTGTLAVAPLSGGTPREIAGDVLSADWTPDGSAMAAIRTVNGKFQLEFPLGKVIYQSEIWCNWVRISPDGNSLAFAQYAAGGSDTGSIVILDKQGKQIARSQISPSVEGIAWPPSGNEVWYGATANHSWSDTIYALTESGRQRVVLRLPGMLRLYDISRSGQVLLSKDHWTSELELHSRDGKESDLSWLDASVIQDITPDGLSMAFGEYGEAGGGDLVTYLRKLDGSPAVRLGAGYGAMFSPDTKSVLVAHLPDQFSILPTGIGEPKSIAPGGFRDMAFWGWMPDGKEIYFAANDGQSWRMYLQNLNSGKPRAFTPPVFVPPKGFDSHRMSLDGRLCFAIDLQGRALFFPVAGGDPRPVPGIVAADNWLNWSSDGRAGFIAQDHGAYADIFRLDLASGARQLISRMAPADRAGMVSVSPFNITPDGKTYGVTFNRSLSDLFIADAVK